MTQVKNNNNYFDNLKDLKATYLMPKDDLIIVGRVDQIN